MNRRERRAVMAKGRNYLNLPLKDSFLLGPPLTKR
jgi:hypothetical protein